MKWVGKYLLLHLLITMVISGCTINWRGDDDAYQIVAEIITPDCEVRIHRQETKQKKKGDATTSQASE